MKINRVKDIIYFFLYPKKFPPPPFFLSIIVIFLWEPIALKFIFAYSQHKFSDSITTIVCGNNDNNYSFRSKDVIVWCSSC